MAPRGLPDFIFKSNERKGLSIEKVRVWAGRLEAALTENKDYSTPMTTPKKEIVGRFDKN